ncbi:MAG: NnrU family protein [Pelagimonas sp.]|jgi:uncharacterized membrane protein|nr:NnrU family protein [Pelagimonas sp.]
MILLVSGVALWWAAHLFKRVAPEARANLGDRGKGLVALALLGAILMMIFGYKTADGAFFWGRHPATVGINNLMMIAALYFTSPGPSKGALFYKMRHPMLTGFVIWALAHILVNGDVASFVLFGGLGLWAIVEIAVINRAEPDWTPPAKGAIKKDIIFAAASIVLLAIIGMVHQWLGYMPWG